MMGLGLGNILKIKITTDIDHKDHLIGLFLILYIDSSINFIHPLYQFIY